MTVRDAMSERLRLAGFRPVETGDAVDLWESPGGMMVVVPRCNPVPPFLAEKVLKQAGIARPEIEELMRKAGYLKDRRWTKSRSGSHTGKD